MKRQSERLIAFTCGMVMVAVIFVTALFVRDPTAFQYVVFRIILSLAAAGFTIFVPAFLEVQIGSIARGTGALAVFLIIYFFSPAALPRPVPDDQAVTHRLTPAERRYFYNKILGRERPTILSANIEIPRKLVDGTDRLTGDTLANIMAHDTVKVVIPTYVDNKCPGSFFEAILLSEALSRYLSKPVDLVMLNMFSDPTSKDFARFEQKWNPPKPWYFISGSEAELQSIARSFAFIFQKNEIGDGKYSYDHSTMGYIFVPEQTTLYTFFGVDRQFDPTKAKADMQKVLAPVLAYILERSPYLLDRSLLSRDTLAARFSLTSPAHAAEPGIPSLNNQLESVLAARLMKVNADKTDLSCPTVS